MKIILTGAAGFFGSYVLKRLAEDGNNRITCIDMSPLKADKGNIRIETGNITDKDFVFKAVRNTDVVIHLAGMTPKFFAQGMYQAMMTNVIGTHNIIEALKGTDAKLIFASTYFVYDTSNPPFDENSKINPKNPYEISKAISEKEIQDSLNNYVIIRFTNLFGYYEKDFLSTGVVAKMIDSACNSGLIKVSGNQKMGFLYVDNAADAIVKVMKEKGIFNVGNAAVSLPELAGIISRKLKLLTGKEIKIEKMPSENSEDRWVSANKIKATAWSPTDIETAIEKTIREYLSDKK